MQYRCRRPVMMACACAAVMAALSSVSAFAQTMPMPQTAPAPKQGPCPAGQHQDPAMNMCIPDDASASPQITFLWNQFMVYSHTSGARGRNRTTGPGMWMLAMNKGVSRHQLSMSLMGSVEQRTVGDAGTPQLFQTEHVDNMHAHDWLMGVEFRDTVALSPDGAHTLTVLFAPRGETAAGPVPFMHRPSAEGNPDAPLGHNMQDGFHDASTVFGVGYHVATTTAEVTVFSGRSISWPLPMHRPDSYSVRLNQTVTDHVGVGASFLNLQSSEDVGTTHTQFISAWMTTSHALRHGTLKSSSIWGQVRDEVLQPTNSLLDEVVYQTGKNKLYGRAEILQETAEQLEIVLANGGADAQWVRAYTIGYERTLATRGGLTLYGGGSFTKNVAPADFQAAYGSGLSGVKASLRIGWTATHMPRK
jgi:hypothetical protein